MKVQHKIFNLKIHHGWWVQKTITGFIFLVMTAVAFGSSKSDRSRIEELFRWKVSDTLQLDHAEEEKFVAILKDVSERRRIANEKIELLSGKLAAVPVPKDIEQIVQEYQKQIKIYSETQVYEFDSLKKLFGSTKMGKYIVIKNDLTNRLKNVIAGRSGEASAVRAMTTDGPGNNENKGLPEPKVIEEQKK